MVDERSQFEASGDSGAGGEELIFVISQPRSGSTLLQHLLASHPDVHTLPEPWLLFPPLYALRGAEVDAPYNAEYASLAITDFLGRLPRGREIFDRGLREFALGLYRQALVGTGARFFLDKTPRYFLIIDEIANLFPRARFVFLIRNPLAVLSSIIDTNFGGDFRQAFTQDRRCDLLEAPRLVREAALRYAERSSLVRYEDLVSAPEAVLGKLCEDLDLEFQAEMLEYGDRVKFENTTFVDPKSIYRHSSPCADYVDAWKKGLDSPQRIHLAEAYLAELGREIIEFQGYDFDQLEASLRAARKGWHLLPVAPWRLLRNREGDLSTFQRLWLSATEALQTLQRSVKQRGFQQTAKLCWRAVTGRKLAQ